MKREWEVDRGISVCLWGQREGGKERREERKGGREGGSWLFFFACGESGNASHPNFTNAKKAPSLITVLKFRA